MKMSKICVPGILEEVGKIGGEVIFKEIMSDSFPKLIKDIVIFRNHSDSQAV